MERSRSRQFERVYIEITNVCNRACSFCPGTTREQRFMTVEDFGFYARRLREYTDCFYLHVMGEPLLHPQLDEILLACDKLSARAVITTNGTLLGEKGERLLRHACVYKIQISLHSFEANARQNDGYFDACFDFARRSSDAGIITILRLWNKDGREAGQNALNDGLLLRLRKEFSGFWSENKRGYCISPKLYLEYGERFVWASADGKELSENGTCRALRGQLALLVDGTVVPCCIDAQGSIPLGNLRSEELEGILENPVAVKMLEGFEKNKLVHPLCKTCGYADRFRKHTDSDRQTKRREYEDPRFERKPEEGK